MPLPIQCEAERLGPGDKPKVISATDGDTPKIQVFICTFVMDAPEVCYRYARGTKSSIDPLSDAGGS